MFALGVIVGVLLALLLTSTATSRQASAPRPAATILATLRPVMPLRTGVPNVPRPTARGLLPTTGKRPASVESQPSAKPTAAPTPESTKRPRATTRPVDGLRGVATWFAAPDGTAAAGPALRAALGADWRGSVVAVSANGRLIRVKLTDWCACGDRHGTPTVIDLGADSFARLAPLSSGVIDVTIR